MNNKQKEFIELGLRTGIFPLHTKQDLADRWGVTIQVVNNWAARHNDFPVPLTENVINGRPLYPLCEVERYERVRGLENGNV